MADSKERVLEKLKYILRRDFNKKVTVLNKTKNINKLIEKTLVLDINSSLSDSNKFGLIREEFIGEAKARVLSVMRRRDPLQMMMVEKACEALFNLEYIRKKYPNDIMLAGTNSAANKFVIELEYLKALLYHQIAYMADSLAYSEEEIESIVLYRRDGPAELITPNKNEKVERVS